MTEQLKNLAGPARGLNRRSVLRGAMYSAAAVPLGVSLASCASGAADAPQGQPEATGQVSADNPFGMAKNTEIDAVIFDGGYGTDYVDFAGEIFAELHAGSTAKVTPSNNIAQKLQPRFVAGNPPDLVDNSGGSRISNQVLLDKVADLTDVIEAVNLEGTPIKDTLYEGVLSAGTVEGKLMAINYVLTVYGVWYSASLFAENGWTAPTTWQEAKALGADAKAKGYYLFGWGKEGATYYETLAIDSAIKQGGEQVRLALENLQPKCWSEPAVQDVLEAIKYCVDQEYFKPGGAGTQFTAAQAQWCNAQEFLLYPTGSWIENEMKDQTAENFQMTGVPAFTVDDQPAMPATALHSTAGEAYVVPSQGNTAAGKELLRVMLSEESARNFSKEKHTSSIVKGLVPEDGFGSTALVSQTDMLDAAGKDVFNFNFMNYYGLNGEHLPLWNGFLAGNKSVQEMTADLQAITDRVREDNSIEKVEVK